MANFATNGLNFGLLMHSAHNYRHTTQRNSNQMPRNRFGAWDPLRMFSGPPCHSGATHVQILSGTWTTRPPCLRDSTFNRASHILPHFHAHNWMWSFKSVHTPTYKCKFGVKVPTNTLFAMPTSPPMVFTPHYSCIQLTITVIQPSVIVIRCHETDLELEIHWGGYPGRPALLTLYTSKSTPALEPLGQLASATAHSTEIFIYYHLSMHTIECEAPNSFIHCHTWVNLGQKCRPILYFHGQHRHQWSKLRITNAFSSQISWYNLV